jgi:hypothetical protein
MQRRLDKLADLGTSMITVSGGEPLMHPELDAMIAQMRRRGMISSVITNGYYLSPERIRRLNDAGLDFLQISIDNVEPDEVSLKSLRLLEPKLKWLAEHAEFGVNINSVVGAGIKNPEDALAVARRARELGFTSTVGILHDGHGQLEAAGGARAEGLSGPQGVRQPGRRALQRRLPGQPGPGPPQRLELPRGRALTCTWTSTASSITARRCAACPAWPSRTTARRTSRGNTRPRRRAPLLHDQLRAAGGTLRQLARSPDRARAPHSPPRGHRPRTARGELA